MMKQLTFRETPSQRDMWNRKIKELREDGTSIRRQGEQYDRITSSNLRHVNERNELLTRRRQRQIIPSSQDERDMNNLADEAKSWEQSQFMVNDLINTGEANLHHLVKQRQQLKGVTKFLGQIDDSLGISNSTMKIIERRDITDAYFVLGGCVVTCIVIYFVWL